MYDIYIHPRSAAVFQLIMIRLVLRNLYCISLLTVRKRLGIKQEKNYVLRVSGWETILEFSDFLADLEAKCKTSEWLGRNQFCHLCFSFPFFLCFCYLFIFIFFEPALFLARNFQLLQYEIIAGKQRHLIVQSDPQMSMYNDHDSPFSRNGASKIRKAALKP